MAWGYLDKPNISENRMVMVDALALCVPTLFLGAVVGLSAFWRTRLGVLGWTGTALAVCGWGQALVPAIVGYDPMWIYLEQNGWPHHLHEWLFLMLTGLTLVGLASVKKPLRRVGFVVLTMGASGWIYYLTDTNAIFEARSVHVGFGLLFSGCWVALGVGLLMAGIPREQRPLVRS